MPCSGSTTVPSASGWPRSGCSRRPWARPIRAHHRLDTVGPEYRHSALVVHLADALCYHIGLADMGEGVVLLPDDPALLELGIGPDTLALLMKETKVESERAGQAFG